MTYGDSKPVYDREYVLNSDHLFKNKSINKTSELLPEGVTITQSLIDTEIPQLNQSKLGKVLTRYYNYCLSGAENWDKLNSFKISAELLDASGLRNQFVSIFKKPNFYKIVTSTEDTMNVVAYDGDNKWKKEITKEKLSVAQFAPELNRMMYEPELSGYLLYPFRGGKKFEYKGVFRESNSVCHRIGLKIERGYEIDYNIDVESFFIVSIKVLDIFQEFKPLVIKYSDHRPVDGVHFAHKIEYYVDGQLDYSLYVKEININVGATNWMFYLNNHSF